MRKQFRWVTWLLFSLNALYCGLATWHVANVLQHGHERSVLPFACTPDGRVSQVSSEAEVAGLRVGDRFEAYEGRQYTGLADFHAMVDRTPAGKSFTATLKRGSDGVRYTASIILHPYISGALSWDTGLMIVAIELVMPVCCLVLSLYILLLAPRDRKASVLFFSLAALMTVFPPGGWSAPLLPVALLCGTFGQCTIGLWLFLFGLYFPEPGGVGWRPRWLRFAAASAIAAIFSFKLTGAAFLCWGPWPAQWISLPWPLIGRLSLALNSAGVLLFLINLGWKASRGSRDSKRRLRILLLGTLLGLGPLVTLAVRAAASGRGLLEGVPGWVGDWSVLALGIFPVTLSYVVVVRRAMDVRVMLRQGLYYSAAKNGFLILRLVAVAAVFGTLIAIVADADRPASARLAWIGCGPVALVLTQEVALKWIRVWIERRFVRDAYGLDDMTVRLRSVGRGDPARYLETVLHAVTVLIGAGNGAALLASDGLMRISVNTANGEPLDRGATPLNLPVPESSEPDPIAVSVHERPAWIDNEQGRQLIEGTSAEMLLPLHGSEGLAGLLMLGPKESGEPYTATDRAVLSSIGQTAGLVLENLLLMTARDSETSERERRKAEAQAAEEANRAKSEFLAKMSHELRTPLNAIIGYSEMLTEEAEDLGEAGFVADLGKIRSAGKHLLDLINSILDISKIEAGKMEVFAETFSIHQLIADVSSMLTPLITAKQNRLQTDLGPGLARMHTDAGKVRQMLINLLSNASKFTEQGVITLSCRRKHGGLVVFSVRDTGIGMTPEQMARLFQPFQQADASIGAKYGGTGLGLTICKRFAELLGGTISVESEQGSGTQFHLELPAIYGGEENLPQSESAGFQDADGPLVLIIDDDPMVHDLFSRALFKEGFRTVLASDADEGVKLAGELKPDAILLDLMLGGTDGWTVMGRLREGKSADEAPPVILMSILDERRKGIALGADGFLVKPVQRQQLKQALDAVLIPRTKQVPRALIVDDEPINRLVLRRMLQAEGWTVSEGANGREGLDILNREQLAAVLLDPVTPIMDGLGFLLELRTRPEASKVPVIVITAKHLTETERQMLANSVDTLLETHAESAEGPMAEEVAREVVARLRKKVTEHAESIAG